MSDIESNIHKQDIDDNCPLTGDETDIEDIHNFQENDKEKEVSLDLDKCSLVECFTINEDHLVVNGKQNTDYAVSSPKTTRQEEDEDESFSSDLNYFTDEETSSIAESYDDFGKEDMEDSCTSEPTCQRKREEKLKRIALRSHLDQLGELVVEKEYSVKQAREELQKSQEHLSALQEGLKSVSNDVKEAEIANKKSAICRLKSKKERLIKELSIEKKVEEKALQSLEQAELCLAQTYIEHAKFLPFDDMLENEEKQNEKLKADKACGRIKKEMSNAAMVERKKRNRDKEHISNVRERERKNRQAVITAKKNREVAMKYLKDTMSRVRQRESEEEDKSRSDLNQRMSALLSLKKNIELNKENIAAVQARDSHIAKKDEFKEKQEREKLLSMDENPDEVLTRRKRIRQFERDKEAFERKQREREIEIVNKIAQEEKQLKKRYQQQPQLWPENRPRRMPRKRSKPRCAPSSGSESMEYGADVEDTGGKLSCLNKFSTDEEGEFSPYGATNRDDDNDDKTTTEEEWEYVEGEDEAYAEAEFKNLWEKNCDKIVENKLANWKSANREYSKLEQEMMKTALSKQKQNIMQQQVAAGREFKGCTFVSNPNVVVFKDFDIGESYKKKLLLTNISYAQTYCKFIGVSENLKDFIDVSFTPPGQLSAGLTCDLYVTFQPKVNRDIIGSLEMMSQTGVFYIPVKCLVKKCEVEIDAREIQFEKEVVGETVKKMFTLKNTGALGTEFKFCKIDKDADEDKRSKISSIGGMSSNLLMENDLSLEEEHSDAEDDCNDDDEVIRIGKIESGTLMPFASVHLDVIFAPITSGSYEQNFILMFSDPTLKPIPLKVKGSSIDLPIWVEREVVDLKICMLDRLYQDAIIVSNRSTSALRIRFEIPKELKNHLDILPKTAYVQAESQFSAQLKFLPRKSLAIDAEEFIRKGNDLLEAPVMIRVADQTQPVPFLVRAVVTSSDFEFDLEEINFGYCSVYETVFQTIQLHNKSVLPQQFGFVNLPEMISVQPNDGFGTVLPNEKCEIYIYFSPTKAKEYRFTLLCKSYIGREFNIRCKAVGVFPPLKLSHSLIKFKATAVNDSSSTHIFVINNHTSTNQFTHPVPRIGNGEIFPVGPTSFHFMVPNDAPITISPAIGTVCPGQKCIVHITFHPKLNQKILDKKALELEAEAAERQKHLEVKLEPVESKDSKQKGKVANKPVLRTKGNVPSTVACKNVDGEKGRDRCLHSFYKKARIALQRTYEESFKSYKIPCFLKYGECGEVQDKKYIDFSVYNTLSLEVHCPSVKPSLIVVSDTGDNLVDFGKVPMRQRHSKVISVQNISEDSIHLKSSLLDPTGPFELVNALRVIEPGAVHTLKLSFTPQDSSKFYEVLEIFSSSTTVQVNLKGQGIKPSLSLEPNDDIFDVGDCLVMDTIYQPLKLRNTSELSLVFDLTLGSLSSRRHNRSQSIPIPLQKEAAQKRNSFFQIGPPNKNGLCVFGCEPCHGTLEPAESKEILISFSPDHCSDLFCDELEVNVNGIEEFTRLHLVGRAWPSITFTRGWDKLSTSEESFHISSMAEKQEVTEKTVLLTMYSSLEGSCFSTAESIIEIGCIKSSIQTKKSCDFTFENTKNANDNGFVIEPMKGGVDIGVRKQLLFKWNPPQNCDPQHLIKTTTQLVVRGDSIITYNIMLRGCIKTNVLAN